MENGLKVVDDDGSHASRRTSEFNLKSISETF